MSDDGEKKSWSEIDQARIRGQKIERTVSKKEQFAQKRASSAAKKELEKLFSGSKIDKEKQTRLDELKELRGKPAYYEGLTKYFNDYGVPLEWDIQMLFLDHRDVKTTTARSLLPLRVSRIAANRLRPAGRSDGPSRERLVSRFIPTQTNSIFPVRLEKPGVAGLGPEPAPLAS